jgi:outer membrane protein
LERFQAKCKRQTSCTVVSWAMLTLVVSITSGAGLGHAESLRGALASAYRFNPDIEAERANLRATDESVSQAQAGHRPNISASADVGANRTRSRPGFKTVTKPSGYQLDISQNVFDGFRTTNSVNQSEANVRAGRAALHATEQTVLLSAATSFMNVVRDQAIVRLRDNNVAVLTKDLTATKDRFKAGEVTRTDVAQSTARRAGSVSDLDSARADLKRSRANYVRVVGNPPSRLRNGNVPEKLLPKTQKAGVQRAISEAPAVVGALYQEQAARYAVEVVWGELLPSVSLDARLSDRFQPTGFIDRTGTAAVVGTVSVPIYSGGIVRSRVRQAKQLHLRQIQLVAQARLRAREFTVSAWAVLQAARAQLRSDKAQVEANGIALSGVREEEKVGQRTLLDTLNAEQELLNAQVRLVQTKRDLVVSAYALIAATGRLTSRELNLTSKVYDAEEHYFDVRRKWFGISITHQNGRQERVDLWDKHGRHRTYK